MTSNRPWPKVGFVTLLGAESQEAVFVPRELIERQLAPRSSLLLAEGDQRWLSASEISDLRRELSRIAKQASPGKDADSVMQAIELVDYEVANRAGVSLVPPAARSSPSP